ncbi:ferric reductase-like transmembrane domain-containing protein [uncultured Alsobacter sp.]|uniref:ferric reductase-like transmembrane domain-containing protein n=1 Tax=uncultured Alsobacter sp. TaxID=1748258 RepID=UPI0025D46144|nr:ferric reductase-like transmembrane domain-containing protein [uncultured Alsobacter sp.]
MDRLRLPAWVAVVAIAGLPAVLAAVSPLQRGREALWVIGGMAGVLAFSLLFVQPVLMARVPRLLAPAAALRWHRRVGSCAIALVLLHVGALYAYSPDDVRDALLLVSPTPFSVYGVIGLVGIVGTAVLVVLRRAWPSAAMRTWRLFHSLLAIVIVTAGAVHALMIEGTMEDRTKLVLCVAAVVAVLVSAWQVNMRPGLRGGARG